MGETITITGIVGTDPAPRTTPSGAELVSFRLASPIRRQDRATGAWVEQGTSWYTVTAWRALAKNVIASIAKGDRVLVTGELRIRSYERQDGSTGLAADVDARAIGHDLTFQTTSAVKTTFERRGEPLPAASPEPAMAGAGADWGASPADGGQDATPAPF